uniref:L-aminoadipate-semialdehyde dehydrogenase-phosphopantetheinyl transferase n=1 Tax=Heterorhabditis bacteriophora TaxID=37862 RepID=A0A1I7WUI5_HETBA
MAIWYVSEPNQMGPVFGGKDYFRGLAVFLDTYSNHNGPHSHGHPFISAMVSDGSLHYDHDKDGTHTQLGGEHTGIIYEHILTSVKEMQSYLFKYFYVIGCEAKFRNREHETQLLIRYVVVVFLIFTDISDKKEWKLCMSVNNVQLPTGYYFGMSAATGDLSDAHDIIAVKMFEQEFAHVERDGEISARTYKNWMQTKQIPVISFENLFEKLYRKAVQCITAEDYSAVPQKQHRWDPTIIIMVYSEMIMVISTIETVIDESHIQILNFKEDALACILGRLLLRYAVHKFSGSEWKDIEFKRTEKGKPYLVTPSESKIGLNVSHQGDYVGFASSCSSKVGIDLMRLDKERNNKTADEYINSMAKSASTEELRMMRSQPTEAMKMTMFYRYWCLKEAILKATGEGILDDLSRIDFRVDTNDRYRPGMLTNLFLYQTCPSLNVVKKIFHRQLFITTFVDLPTYGVAQHSVHVTVFRSLVFGGVRSSHPIDRICRYNLGAFSALPT